MNEPRLLKYSSRGVIADEVFADLQLKGLFSESAVRVMSVPADAEEIKRRQELFLRLRDGEFLARVSDCVSILKDCRRKQMLWGRSDVKLEKLFLYIDVLLSYADACRALSSFTDGGALLSSVAEYFGRSERKELTEAILCDAMTASRHMTASSRFLISFSDKVWVTPNTAPSHLGKEIAECALRLGLEVPKRSGIRVRPDRSLSNAVCELYGEDIAAAEAILSSYKSLNLGDVLNYIEELEFFLEIHSFTEKAERLSIKCTIPSIAEKKRYFASELYDVSLMKKDSETIVPNDVEFTLDEPLSFLVGANGGGKTTYLRAVGINLILFLSGCPVFAAKAEIYPFSSVFSHFPLDERFDGVGRLDKELERSEKMLKAADDDAFLIFNETFSGADDKRGFSLLLDIAERIKSRGMFGLYVTHFHEVSDTDYPILTAEIDPFDENRRTYRITRRYGRTGSYAMDILKKYRLDKAALDERRENDDDDDDDGDQPSLP